MQRRKYALRSTALSKYIITLAACVLTYKALTTVNTFLVAITPSRLPPHKLNARGPFHDSSFRKTSLSRGPEKSPRQTYQFDFVSLLLYFLISGSSQLPEPNLDNAMTRRNPCLRSEGHVDADGTVHMGSPAYLYSSIQRQLGAS